MDQNKKSTHAAKLATKIGLNIQNTEIYIEALTHRSYVNENRQTNSLHNERLEFLGDAVLELLTTQFLFAKYPERPEGDLTSFRAALVRTESLAETAAKLGYGELILMSKGEEATGGRERPYILANTFEAVLGAIYQDIGLQACDKFLQRELLSKIDSIVEHRSDVDPKSRLQELAQEIIKATPAYNLLSATGPDHDKVFEMSVMINGTVFGNGSGKSKQEAEQNAAQAALTNWQEQYQKYQDSVKINLERQV
jgi:ribonuclease-3